MTKETLKLKIKSKINKINLELDKTYFEINLCSKLEFNFEAMNLQNYVTCLRTERDFLNEILDNLDSIGKGD